MTVSESSGRPRDSHETATVANGLYTIKIEMRDGKRGRATGVVVLCNGRIMGGDSYFYYTGRYTEKNGKWRGELTNHQHTEAAGLNLAFGGKEVTCGFTGVYSDGEAEVEGTALVGKTSVLFRAKLTLREPL
jgi:T3SS negative regulator,GrlR